MKRQVKTLWHHSAELSDIQLEQLNGPGQLLIESAYSMLSLGTERLVAKGLVPQALHTSMQVPYMKGDFNFPIKYGYSMVGKVLTEEHSLQGAYVHFLHPHQDYCLVEEKDVFVIPKSVDLSTATLASNLETALNAVWDSGVSIGDRALVVGFGLIGSLVARLLDLIPEVEVQVLELDPKKQALAEKLGFSILKTSEELFDVAFNCSASAQGLQSCIDLTGFESKIIELSWYGNQTAMLQLGGTFHQQRKQLISSQVSSIPADRRGRWDYKRRKSTVFNLLKNPIFKHHISQNLKFAVVPKLFEQIRREKVAELGICIAY